MAVQTHEPMAVAALTPAERVVARFLPSLADIVFFSIFLGALFGLQGRLLGTDGDAAWNLRIGGQILAHGLPRTEFMLRPTLGQPEIYFEWLAQVIYALALRIGGLNGVVALAAAFVALEMTLLFNMLRRRGVTLPLALVATLAGGWLTAPTWTARAQHFTLIFVLLWWGWLWRYWRNGDSRLLWCFPLTMVVWANLHGGFISGFVLLGVVAAVAWLFPSGRDGANPRHLSLALAGSIVASLVNPWGPALLVHIVTHLSNPLVLANTKEFLSPDFHSAYGMVFLLLLFATAGVLIWRARLGHIVPLDLAMAAVWTALALQSVRFVSLWALIVLPILCETLMICLRANGRAYAASWPPRLKRYVRGAAQRFQRVEALDRVTGRGLWAALALAAVLVVVLNNGALPGRSSPVLTAQFDATVFPIQAAARLHADGLPAGAGFTTYTWGSYLDYALPEYHPFIDSRSDVYGEQLLSDYLDIVGLAPDWRHLLDHYAIRWALLSRTEPLAQALPLLPGWSCAPADDQQLALLCVLGSHP
ncbi:MAG: hypothetical protein ACRDHP_01530 [Ktedonobacterales bacterium]